MHDQEARADPTSGSSANGGCLSFGSTGPLGKPTKQSAGQAAVGLSTSVTRRRAAVAIGWLGLPRRSSEGTDGAGGFVSYGLRRLLATTVLVAMAALASGCSDDRVRPSDTLPPLPPTSATPTPTEDPPGATGYPLPEEARAYTPEGARAFFDYFIAVLNASSAANDPIPLREIGQGCEFCDELTQRLQQNATDGIRVVGGDLVPTEVGIPTMRPLESGATGAGMVFRLIQQPAQAFDAAGAPISDTPEIRAEGTVEMAWLAEQRDWLVSVFSVDAQ